MSQELEHSLGRQTETRTELMQVPNLWEFFCERTSLDARRWFQRKAGAPPIALLIGTVLATIFCVALQTEIWFVFGAISLAQLVWIAFVRSSNTRKDIDKILLDIARGEFPPEMRESIVKRLRWWNYLIVPHEWGTGSRIFDIQDKLDMRLHELRAEALYWESGEGAEKRSEMEQKRQDSQMRKKEQQQKLKLLQSRGVNVTGLEDEVVAAVGQGEVITDPELLSRLIRNNSQRDEQMLRIKRILDPLARCNEEMVFIKALLLKTHKITELLEKLDLLQPPLEKLDAENADRVIRDSINILEQRRSLVTKINNIPAKQVIKLLSFDTNFARVEEVDE